MFSSLLQNILEDKGYNVNQFSKMAGISSTTVYGYLKGSRLPTYENILHIANTLCVPVTYFFPDSIQEDCSSCIRQRTCLLIKEVPELKHCSLYVPDANKEDE